MQRSFMLISAAVILCVGIAAAAVQGLHAQVKPVAYVIFENAPTDRDALAKEFVQLAQKSVRDYGGKFLRGGGPVGELTMGAKLLSIAGDPPKTIIIFQFENLDKAQEWSNSSSWRSLVPIGQKYTSYFRMYAVEGLSQ